MKLVAHVISGLGRGGAEKVLKDFVSLNKNSSGYKFFVVSLTTLGCYGDDLKKEGVPVYALNMQKGLMWSFFAFFRLILIMRAHKPDVVHTWMYHADLIGGLATLFLPRTGLLWAIHSFDLKKGASRTTRAVQKVCAYLSRFLPDQILCVANSSKEAHVSVGYFGEKIRVVPNGFDIEIFESYSSGSIQSKVKKMREDWRIPAEHFVVGVVGRFHPAKDHLNFIKAAGILYKKLPLVTFVMIGAGLIDSNKLLSQWIAEYASGVNFLLLGERKDVPFCLRAMDIFCSSSRTEAFPLVVGEAMLSELAIVATDVGDTAYLLGDSGWTVPPEKPDALADALLSMLAQPEQYRIALGQSAKKRVEEFFNDKLNAQRIIDIYTEICGDK